MALEPDGEGLQSLQEQEGAERRERRAAVAEVDGAAPHRVGGLRELLGVDDAVEGGLGPVEHRETCRDARPMGTVPASMMAPPSVVPWPPMNLVKDSTTTSAPCSIGFRYIGVAIVLSTMSGTPWRWASSLTASRSTTLSAGLPTDSQKIALVRRRSAARCTRDGRRSAKRTSMPRPGSTWAKRV